MNPHETDDSIIYMDTRRFTRGRPGYRPEPKSDTSAIVVGLALALLGAGVVGGIVFGIAHALMPNIQ